MINKDKNRRSASQPDRIVTWDVPETTTLLAFVEKRLADHSKTKVKSMLKHNQFAVNSMPTSQFDTPLEDGDKVLISKYAGTEVKVDGVEYSILRQSEILAIVE